MHMSARNRTTSLLSEVNFFLRQPRRILNRLLDIVAFQVGIARENLVKRRSMRDLTDDNGYGDAHTADTSPPPMI